jgi:membrane dipeptidase
VPTLHQDAVIVDCHNDLPVMTTAFHRKWGRMDHFREWVIPQLRAGGVDVQILPVYTEPEIAEAGLRHVLLTIEQIHRDIAANGDDVSLCLTGAEIDQAVGEGKIAMVIALEGCAALGTDVELFETMFRLGVRIASFTHFPRTLLGDGSAEEATGGRLSSSGVAAVREMERLGLLVDVSQLSEAGTQHILEIATRPVIATHSASRALRDHHRNLTDAHLRAIAATGGVIGCAVLPLFIAAEDPTIDGIVDHIAHMVEIAGFDHIGLGPDFIQDYYDQVYPHLDSLPVPGLENIDLKKSIPGMVGSPDLPNLTRALRQRGFNDSDVLKILGENFLRVFRHELGIPMRARSQSG